MHFSEVRNYQAGDEIRHMEWRITARTGKPHIKLYQEERERPVVIVADFNPSMYFGTRLAFKSVICARLAAMLAWTAVKQGDWVGGLLFSAATHNEYIPKARQSGVLTLLGALSEYANTLPVINTPTESRTLAQALLRLNRVVKPGSVLVLISDFYHLNEECEQLLARLCDHNEVLAYHICDPLELAPPKPQQYAVSNGTDDVLFDTRNPVISDAYLQYCQHRMATLDKQFKRLRIQSVRVTAEEDIPRLVHYTFPRRNNA